MSLSARTHSLELHTHAHMFPAAKCSLIVSRLGRGREGVREGERPWAVLSFSAEDLDPTQLGHIITAIFCLFIPSFKGLRVTDLHATHTQKDTDTTSRKSHGRFAHNGHRKGYSCNSRKSQMNHTIGRKSDVGFTGSSMTKQCDSKCLTQWSAALSSQLFFNQKLLWILKGTM